MRTVIVSLALTVPLAAAEPRIADETLFQAGEGKSNPGEYAQPGHVEEEVVRDIADWIVKKN